MIIGTHDISATFYVTLNANIIARMINNQYGDSTTIITMLLLKFCLYWICAEGLYNLAMKRSQHDIGK